MKWTKSDKPLKVLIPWELHPSKNIFDCIVKTFSFTYNNTITLSFGKIVEYNIVGRFLKKKEQNSIDHSSFLDTCGFAVLHLVIGSKRTLHTTKKNQGKEAAKFSLAYNWLSNLICIVIGSFESLHRFC